MIITLTRANFSTCNIGTLTTVNVKSTVSGTCANVVIKMPNVEKAGYTTATTIATISLNTTNYKDHNVKVMMGSADVTSTWYSSTSGNVIVPANTPITSNITIYVSATAVSGGDPIIPDEPEQPGTGGSGETIYPTIDIEVGTINAPDGNNGGSTSARWRSTSYTDISNISSTICLTGCKYIISCYNSSKTYLGQKSASGTTLIKGSGQWLESGTVVNISELKNNGVIFVRFVLQSDTGISIKLDGVECFGSLVESGSGSGSSSTNYEDFELNYPFKYGSIVKETGAELAISSSRRVRTDFISVDTLSPNFTVKETRYLVCCYGESDSYLGQYNGTEIISGDTITAAQWINQNDVTTTNNLVSLGVKNIKIVGESGTLLPFVYVNDVKMTKPE